MSAIVRNFEGAKHANIYAQFRPTVPDIVVDEVLNFLNQKIDTKDWNIVVDVGCGSGQGTNSVSKYFKECYGFDINQAQINEAKGTKYSPNVHYDVSQRV